ncbi:hypothetical protein RHCRD62_80054 [Rhodococcus sp. RD6.2]|nr:hypothetical protein RHCRD62_80054 [Rhodococcus sp. RD6.2]
MTGTRSSRPVGARYGRRVPFRSASAGDHPPLGGHHVHEPPGEDHRRHPGLSPGLDPVSAAPGSRGRTERAHDRLGRRRVRHHGHLRWPGRDAHHATHRPDGCALLELPHDRALLTDPGLAAHRPQRHHERHGHRHRTGVRVPRNLHPHPVRERLRL